ncbi:MAG TPA: LuxR C-terminal-related transcriptional regulator [Acidimicrobiales bacterium]
MSALFAESTTSAQTGVGATAPCGVLVYAKDPVSRAGVTSQLAQWRGIDILDPRQGHLAEVAVVVSERVDPEVLRVIRTIRRGSRARVVLVVTDIDRPAATAAAEAGATGLLRRSTANGEQLASVVGKAHRGEPVLAATGEPEPDCDTQTADAGPAADVPPHRLSARDIEVLRLLAEGCDTAEIAQRLAYSEPTIKNVIQRLFDQLKVRNRPHAVAVAMRARII